MRDLDERHIRDTSGTTADNSDPATGIQGKFQRFRSFIFKYKLPILILWLILFITGVIVWNRSDTIANKTEISYSYEKCVKFSGDIDSSSSVSCSRYLLRNPDKMDCFCYHKVNLQNLIGEVTLYYELPSFNQTSTNYSNSKDNNQLRGILTNQPSDNCIPYQYDDANRTIVPCGAIADSMFTDEVYELKMLGNETIIVDLLRYGMLSDEDKAGFHNPENLTYALQNFSKPRHWSKHIYELDKDNADNNGFQNEYFISWMRTDWNRKPIARVDHGQATFKDGLPDGEYQIVINYLYSPSRYSGQRTLIFSSKYESVFNHKTAGGCILAVSIVILAVIIYGLYPVMAKKYSDLKNRNKDGKTKQNENEIGPPPLLSEAKKEDSTERTDEASQAFTRSN